MILISTYESLWGYFCRKIQSISRHFVVADVDEMQEIASDLADGEVVLIAVIPSSDIETSNFDDIEEIDTCWVFVLKKSDPSSMTREELSRHRNVTQQIITDVKKEILRLTSDYAVENNYTRLLHGLVPGRMHTDPEYNFLGCNGWSLSFAIKTKGVDNA
ncbi:MAG TPA: hypothetical protein PKN44_10145 [Bacteroidales bacterium]|nr:hypothetical protein [Bacteroidales bacterium]